MRDMLRQWLGLWIAAPVLVLAPASIASAAGAHQTAAQIQIGNSSKLGAILVNSAGMTLYTLSSEAGANFRCQGGCLSVWPPLTLPTDSKGPTLGAGVTGQFGAVRRPDGTFQATYLGLPLYAFAHDSAPGDTNGDGIQAFGGTWHAARPQDVALSATPAFQLTLRMARVHGTPAGRVTARYALGGMAQVHACLRAACTLAVPRGTSVRLTAQTASSRFVGWKVEGRGAEVLRGSSTRVSVGRDTTVKALFAAN